MAGNKKENLTMKMLAALAAGLIAGLGAIAIRENVNPETWDAINRLLFADISAPGNESAAGLFYIAGQLFVRSLQLIIVPMVFTSIVLAMIRISDSRKLGRISARTLGYFLATTLAGIILASAAGMAAYSAGAFRSAGLDLAASEGKTGTNALMIIVNAVPNNFVSALSNNSGVLAVVVTALAVGLCINARRDRIEIIPKICREISDIITVFLTFTVNKFGPVAIFCLISRTCASYGIAYLKPALAYVLLTTALLLLILFAGYALFVKITTGLNPVPFVKKTARVALFGFSTSSSAAALPLNMKTATEELGVHEEIASFVLPLGMTVNMDGTAVMQVIAAIFIAGCAGYDISVQTVLMIGVLAVIASIGTPAAPGAGAVILFTILSGAGFTNETALMTYSLILAINRPIEMLVTALNVAGDTACAVAVAKSENALDEKVYAAGTDRQ